jgi:uncharacterized protein (TIGR00725 family)
MSAKYQICISGAAKGGSVRTGHDLAATTAREVARRGHILLTGATSGLPHAAAVAALDAGGVSIGFSPAASRREHCNSYRLPIEGFTSILYTGFGYTGRDLLLVRSSDAVIMIGGRIGTLHEFAIALEEHKPLGVLLGSGGMTVEIERVLRVAQRSRSRIVFDDDPIRLVDSVLAMTNHKFRRMASDEAALS